MKLESLARLNGFDSKDAHSAIFDTELTVKVLGLLKKKQPDLWHEYLKTKSKVVVENLIKQEKMFTINEFDVSLCAATDDYVLAQLCSQKVNC